MTNDGQRGTLLVVHVPKAAGSTFRWILDRQYLPSAVFKIGDDIPDERVRLAEMRDADKRQLRAVFGHMCWGWHDALAEGQEFHYVTLLREPIERVLSLYAYSQLPGHYLSSAVNRMSVYDYVTSGVTRTADNGMVRQLCGLDQFLREPYADMELPFGSIGRDHAERARANLESCAVVGTAERFEAMLVKCRERFGWRIPAFRDQNVTRWPRPKREWLDQRTLDAIEAHNKLDRELWEYAGGLS